MNNMDLLTHELLLLLVPVVLAVYGFVAFCIVKILKEGVANLNKSIWIFIVSVANLFGCIAYLLFGRRRDI